MARLNPYLQFNGNCREAMRFYQECLGGELTLQTFGDSPMAQDMPAAQRDQVLHSMLVADGIVLMASDMMGEEPASPGGRVTLCLNSEDREEITASFNKLAVGGAITQPLIEAFFGLFGTLTDRYGFNWMFQAGAGPSA